MAKLSKQIKKGMNVEITAGKHKGKSGEVIKFDRKTHRIYVSGINELTDFTRLVTADGNQDSTPRIKNLGIDFSNVRVAKKINKKDPTKSIDKKNTSKKTKTKAKKETNKKTKE